MRSLSLRCCVSLCVVILLRLTRRDSSFVFPSSLLIFFRVDIFYLGQFAGPGDVGQGFTRCSRARHLFRSGPVGFRFRFSRGVR